MTSSALPDNWQELLAGYVLGDLDADETAQVERLLSARPDLVEEVRSLQSALDLLPLDLPPQQPSADLRNRILTAAQPAPTTPARSSAPRRNFLSAWLGLGWAVTAVALGALALDNYRLRQEQLELKAVVASFSQPTTRFYALVGTKEQPQAVGRLVIDPNQQSASIVTDELATLPTGQAYRLWAMAEGKPVYCGQFTPTPASSTPIRWQLPEAACDSTTAQMLVTAESASAPPVPAGPLVLQSQS